ncbi:MAG TPA: HAD family phosphatase [Phycisphaerae bacterium]|nr:HAD family phosphatase [Phycisphaerae bacterium]
MGDVPIGVIFDMDGVLVDSAEAHLWSWQALARRRGVELTREQFARTFGMRSSEIITRLFGVSDEAEIHRLDHDKESIYRDHIRHRVPEMPGAVQLVRGLHAAGLRIAIGSSGPPENVNLVCEDLAIEPFIDVIVTGRDVQRGKPDPQVFQIAAKRMSLAPGRCVVVEDAPAGIEAARRAEMHSIGLVGMHRAEALASADRVVHSLHEISSSLIRDLVASAV